MNRRAFLLGGAAALVAAPAAAEIPVIWNNLPTGELYGRAPMMAAEDEARQEHIGKVFIELLVAMAFGLMGYTLIKKDDSC